MTIGGARSADDVAAQIAVSAKSHAGDATPGIVTKASADSTDKASIHPPRRRMAFAARSAAMPSAMSMTTKMT